MKLEDIAGFGCLFVDKEGRELWRFEGKTVPLKYGELMGNRAAHCPAERRVFQLLNEGRDVGFVNHLDILAAARFMLSTHATGIFKHTGVCGAAYGFDQGKEAEEYATASEVDEVARFGGIIGVPRVTRASAEEIVGKKGQKKQDGVVALEFEDGAVDVLLHAKNPPLIYHLLDEHFDIPPIDIQAGLDGPVFQERISPLQRADLHVATGSYALADKVLDDIIFGFKVADTRHSNAIVFVEPTQTGAIAVGIAGGPSDRITAAYHAMEKAVTYYLLKYLKVPKQDMPQDINVALYMASDGFFPDTGALQVATRSEIKTIEHRIVEFPYQTQRGDFLARNKELCVLLEQEKWDIQAKMFLIACRLNITVPLVLNPGGSKKDEAVIQYAADNSMTMLVTERDGKHLRCFKHGPQSAYAVR